MTSKKLLVLDVNGLLVDTYFYKEPLPEESPDARVGSFYVYKRPFCEEFLQFCLENFTVGIWSSAREHNVSNLVEYVFGGTKEKLAFSWHQFDCTDLGLKSPDNQWKPLFLKELSKLWRRDKVDLPWKEGNYGPSNTLLVDDTPYKAILNPPNTAIFPRSYTARDRSDNFLGGALRSYLEGIRDAASVQTYVENNPFGEPSITPASPLWSYVNEVVLKVKNVLNNVGNGVAQIMPVEAVSDEIEKPNVQHGKWKHHSHPLEPVEEVTDEDNIAGKEPVEEVTDEDNNTGKHKRWRIRKQEYVSDSTVQLANNHFQSSGFDFPSEAVELQSNELQSSDRMWQLQGSGEQVHGSSADQQVHEIANLGGRGMVDLPLNQTEQGHPGALESATQAGNMHEDFKRMDVEHEENQAIHDENHRPFDKQGNIEGPFVRVIDAGIDAELDRLYDQHQDDADGTIHSEVNESNEKLHIPIGDGSLKASEPYCMQEESNCEEISLGRQETRDNNFRHASNNNAASQHRSMHCDRRRHKHREAWEDPNKRHNPRHNSNRGRCSHGDRGWKNEERYRQGDRGQMPFPSHFDERGHHFANKQHMKYADRGDLGKGYQNRTKHPPRYSHQRWDDKPPAQPAWGASTHDSRSWGQSQQDSWQPSSTKTPINASFGVLDRNFSTNKRGSVGRVRKYDEYGQGQDMDPLGYSRPEGFEQGANLFSERIEQPNVNVRNLDSDITGQAEARGRGKRQWFDFASEEGGAVSQPYSRASRPPYQNVEARPYSNKEAFSQPYRGQHGGSRQPYYNAGTFQSYHNSWDNYRQGGPSEGFSRSRQSQKARKW